MNLSNLEKLAKAGLDAHSQKPDPVYINELRNELISEGILEADRTDEGIVDLAKNAGRVVSQTASKGLKTGIKTFLTYLFSGANAKKMEKDMRGQVDSVVAEVNQQVKKLGAEQRTPKVITAEVSKGLKKVLGPLGFKLFSVVVANDAHAVSIIENPRIISGMTEPLVKISLTFEPSQSAPEEETDFIEATFSKNLGKRLFELKSAFAKKEDSNRVHDESTSMHSSANSSQSAASGEESNPPSSAAPDAGVTKTSANTAAVKTGNRTEKSAVKVAGSKPAPEKPAPEMATSSPAPAEKTTATPASTEKEAAPKILKTWAEYKAAKIEPLNKGKPDVKPNIDGESKVAVAEDFVNHMLAEWKLFTEHGFSIPVKRMPEIKAMAKVMGNFIKAEGKLTDMDRFLVLAEMKKLIEVEETRGRFLQMLESKKQ